MLQMGLNVISVEGMRIKQLRTYAMKCKGCFKSVDMFVAVQRGINGGSNHWHEIH